MPTAGKDLREVSISADLRCAENTLLIYQYAIFGSVQSRASGNIVYLEAL
jgi:hypothetical protein